MFITSAIASCPPNSVEVLIHNTSPNKLVLETKDENSCEKRSVATVKPGIKGKYCIAHDYVLKISTYSLVGDTRLAVTATDLWNPVVITTPHHSMPDIHIQHMRGDEQLIGEKNNSSKKEHKVYLSEETPISHKETAID